MARRGRPLGAPAEPHLTTPWRAIARTATDLDVAVALRVQALARAPIAVRSAVLLSAAGEHALGPLAVGLAGAAVDGRRRGAWLRAVGAVAAAHALASAVKRLVHRRRPQDPRIAVRLPAPSSWSFPSSHAASTAAAAIAYSSLLGRRLPLASVPLMMASRVIVGLHYPSDVLAGAALGGAVASLAMGGAAASSGRAAPKPIRGSGPRKTEGLTVWSRPERHADWPKPDGTAPAQQLEGLATTSTAGRP